MSGGARRAEQLGQNHQVLAYGYDLAGSSLTLDVYDPNAPDDDTSRLTLSLAGVDHPCLIACTTIPRVYCVFRSRYRKATPPSPVDGV